MIEYDHDRFDWSGRPKHPGPNVPKQEGPKTRQQLEAELAELNMTLGNVQMFAREDRHSDDGAAMQRLQTQIDKIEAQLRSMK